MKIEPLNLFIEINNFNFVFVAVERVNENYSKIILEENIPIQGIQDNKITDYNLILKIFREKINLLEQNLNLVFKKRYRIYFVINFYFNVD